MMKMRYIYDKMLRKLADAEPIRTKLMKLSNKDSPTEIKDIINRFLSRVE